MNEAVRGVHGAEADIVAVSVARRAQVRAGLLHRRPEARHLPAGRQCVRRPRPAAASLRDASPRWSRRAGATRPTSSSSSPASTGATATTSFRRSRRAGFRCPIQLMSGLNAVLTEEARRLGERHGLTMLPVLEKPFRVPAVRQVIEQLGLRRDALALDPRDARRRAPARLARAVVPAEDRPARARVRRRRRLCARAPSRARHRAARQPVQPAPRPRTCWR